MKFLLKPAFKKWNDINGILAKKNEQKSFGLHFILCDNKF